MGHRNRPTVCVLLRCDPEHQKQRFTSLNKRDEVHALAAFDDLSSGCADGKAQIDNYFSLMRSVFTLASRCCCESGCCR
jgi:hypothetical protein